MAKRGKLVGARPRESAMKDEPMMHACLMCPTNQVSSMPRVSSHARRAVTPGPSVAARLETRTPATTRDCSAGSVRRVGCRALQQVALVAAPPLRAGPEAAAPWVSSAQRAVVPRELACIA
jgi:hypothetical protein